METEVSRLIPLTRWRLLNLRLGAIRQGAWFKILNKIERGMIDLVLRTVRKVRSSMLARSLIIIVKKLLNGMESPVARQMRTIGFSLAQRMSRIAQGWGNKSAQDWVKDSGFLRYLAVNYMNSSP